MSALPRPGRAAGVLLAAGATAALVAGCGAGASGSGGGAAAATGSSSSAAPGAGSAALAKGLLPAEAFGSGTTVVGLDLEQLRKTAAGRLGALQGVQVQPAACAAVLQELRSAAGSVGDVAAKSATGQGQVTVEALLRGGPATDGVTTLRSALTSCPQMTLSAGQLGTATVTLAPVDVSSMGSSAEAAQVTATVTPTGHAPVTLSALVGAVQDHDRLLLLLTGTQGQAAPDQAQFTSLLQKASSTEHEALD